MTSDVDVAALRYEELLALVQQLRQQLAERDRQIAHLTRRLIELSPSPATDESGQRAAPAVQPEPDSGSQEDLLAQLEKVYPEGR